MPDHQSRADSPKTDSHMRTRSQLPRSLQVALFVGIFVALQWAWARLQGGAFDRLVIEEWTVKPATWFVNLLTPNVEAVAGGSRIRAVGGGINVINGCEGLDVLALTTAAFCVYRTHWRRWLIGFLLGIALVWSLNQARIVALFYANRYDKDLFATLHGTVAPLVLVTLVTMAFALFVRTAPAKPPTA